MEEVLHQPPVSARPTRGRRWAFAAACLALVLTLPVAGLGLAVRTAMRDRRPPAASEDGVARVAREYRDALPSASLQEVLAHPDVIPTHHHPLLGRQAPHFELADPDGKAWDLGEVLAGGPVVLIFYYGYHCDHCVRQLFAVHRDLPLFREVGASVLAISADPPELTRQRFQQYGPFGFPVLCDPGNRVAHAYQVFRTDLLRHATFLIDRKGTVRWVNVGDSPFRRNPALLYHLAEMEGRSASVRPSP